MYLVEFLANYNCKKSKSFNHSYNCTKFVL